MEEKIDRGTGGQMLTYNMCGGKPNGEEHVMTAVVRISQVKQSCMDAGRGE
jgi:hypothetical protein